jgi:hypothetical protein
VNARRPTGPSAGGPSAAPAPEAVDRARGARERLRISGISVVAGAAAAATASAATSVLGVAGTVVGAAVVSAVITVAAAVYDHSLRQAKLRLAERMEVTARLPRLREDGTVEPDPGAGPDQGSVGRSTFISPLEATAEGVDVPRGGATAADVGSMAESTAELPVAYETPTTRGALPLDPLDLEDERGYHWGRIAAVSLLVFALAMVVVTGFELVTGRPLSSLFTDSPARGTTVGHIVRPQRDPTPTTPSPTPTTPSPTPTTPSPTPTTPSPTPTTPSPTPTTQSPTATPTAATATPTRSPTGATSPSASPTPSSTRRG